MNFKTLQWIHVDFHVLNGFAIGLNCGHNAANTISAVDVFLAVLCISQLTVSAKACYGLLKTIMIFMRVYWFIKISFPHVNKVRHKCSQTSQKHKVRLSIYLTGFF